MDGQALKKVLVLDDDPAVANSLGMILSAKFYEVRVAYRAEVALTAIVEWRPDIAIVDILLPGMNGVDFALRLERICPGCHVLLFTAFPGYMRAVESARVRGHVYEILEKPIAPRHMLTRIAELLGGGPRPADA